MDAGHDIIEFAGQAAIPQLTNCSRRLLFWKFLPQLSSSLWSSQSRCPSQRLVARTQRPERHLKWLGEHSVTMETDVTGNQECFSLSVRVCVPSTPASGSRHVVFPPSSGNWLQSESSGHCNPTIPRTDSHFAFALRHNDLQGGDT